MEDVLVIVATNLFLVAVEPNFLIGIAENVTEKVEVEVVVELTVMEDVKFAYGVVLGTANMEGISMRIASGVVDTTDNLYSLGAPVAREIIPVPKKADTFCGCRFLTVMAMKGTAEA